MKRALSLILALVMALTLVACGNKNGGERRLLRDRHNHLQHVHRFLPQCP